MRRMVALLVDGICPKITFSVKACFALVTEAEKNAAYVKSFEERMQSVIAGLKRSNRKNYRKICECRMLRT